VLKFKTFELGLVVPSVQFPDRMPEARLEEVHLIAGKEVFYGRRLQVSLFAWSQYMLG
jgi:hypothetical protein